MRAATSRVMALQTIFTVEYFHVLDDIDNGPRRSAVVAETAQQAELLCREAYAPDGFMGFHAIVAA